MSFRSLKDQQLPLMCTLTIPLGDTQSLENIPLFHDNITLHFASTDTHTCKSLSRGP